jgi:polyhydroxybutyrate depolymerase
VRAYVFRFVLKLGHCSVHHLHEKDPTSVDSLTWSSGDHKPIAVLYTVHGGGHVVPQPAFRYPRMLGRTAGDLDAPSSALQFFELSQ